MTTVLIVEDEQALAQSIQRGLEDNGYHTKQVGTVRAALDALDTSHPDLLLLDLGLPDGDGLTVLQTLRQRGKTCPVIILTARDRVEERVVGLDQGADDYMVKPFEFGELLARIRVQLRHVDQVRASFLTVADLSIDMLKRTVRRDGEAIELTPREFDVLACLANAQGAVVSRSQLATEVWRVNRHPSSLDNVIDVHLSRLRERIDKHRTPHLLHTVRGVGFQLKEPS